MDSVKVCVRGARTLVQFDINSIDYRGSVGQISAQTFPTVCVCRQQTLRLLHTVNTAKELIQSLKVVMSHPSVINTSELVEIA